MHDTEHCSLILSWFFWCADCCSNNQTIFLEKISFIRNFRNKTPHIYHHCRWGACAKRVHNYNHQRNPQLPLNPYTQMKSYSVAHLVIQKSAHLAKYMLLEDWNSTSVPLICTHAHSEWVSEEGHCSHTKADGDVLSVDCRGHLAPLGHSVGGWSVQEAGPSLVADLSQPLPQLWTKNLRPTQLNTPKAPMTSRSCGSRRP